MSDWFRSPLLCNEVVVRRITSWGGTAIFTVPAYSLYQRGIQSKVSVYFRFNGRFRIFRGRMRWVFNSRITHYLSMILCIKFENIWYMTTKIRYRHKLMEHLKNAIEIWHFDLLEMAWHQSWTSIVTLMQLSYVVLRRRICNLKCPKLDNSMCKNVLFFNVCKLLHSFGYFSAILM